MALSEALMVLVSTCVSLWGLTSEPVDLLASTSRRLLMKALFATAAVSAALAHFREGRFWWPVVAVALSMLLRADRAKDDDAEAPARGGAPSRAARADGATGGAVPAVAPTARRPGVPGLSIDLNGAEFLPNSAAPLAFENDLIRGEILLIMRTEPVSALWSEYFEARPNQMFELQIQGSFKRLPVGTLFMGAEIQSRPRVGKIMSRLITVVMNFVQRRMFGLHWALGEAEYAPTPAARALWEAPHIVFPLARAMDRVVVTADGDDVPKLGGELDEPLEQRDARRQGRSPDVAWALGSTYSFSFMSQMIDFASWRVINLPVGNIRLASIMGDQGLDIVVYDLCEDASRRAGHVGDNKRYFFRCAMSFDAEAAARAEAVGAAPAATHEPSARAAPSVDSTPPREPLSADEAVEVDEVDEADAAAEAGAIELVEVTTPIHVPEPETSDESDELVIDSPRPEPEETSRASPAPAVPGVLIAEEVYLAEAPGASPTASAIAEADG